jgi:transposase
MSLHPHPVGPVPEETARVAHAAFPTGTRAIRMRDAIGVIFDDDTFAPLFSGRGQPAESPWRLALVTILQYTEGLSDRQAADAVRARIDWKYALSLELTDPGFDSSVLSEFRTRLIVGDMEQLLLDQLLTHFRAHHLLAARGRQRTDSTHVLAAVRKLNRLERAGETLRHALNTLATVAPDWLREHAHPAWVDRYSRRVDDSRLPTASEERRAMAETIGGDDWALLGAIYATEALAWLREVPAVETLRRMWIQQYVVVDDILQWRTDAHGIPPSARFITSPYDRDAHYSKKRATEWVGYKVHLSETCDDNLPRLITHVETSGAPIADGDRTATIHTALADKALLPATHIVDSGYVTAPLLVSSKRDFAVDLLGPTRPDTRWQARAGNGFDVSAFTIDREAQQAICPEGHRSSSWSPAIDRRDNDVITIQFSTSHCRKCTSRPYCIQSPDQRYPRRVITVRPQEQYLALQAARARATTAAYKEEYARRAGIEGTISQGVRAFGLRRCRYIGEAKTHLQHVLTATAINFIRVDDWLTGKTVAQTRRSAFAALMQAAA